jgi:RluA family pseudouridine synthase
MIEVLFADDDIIFVNKPAGLNSQQTLDKKIPHVTSQLEKQFPGQKFYLHHRLDRDTSGVMLLGKSERANKFLTDIFREHKIQKTYLAFIKKEKPITEKKWTVKNHLAPVRDKAAGKKLMRMVVVKKGGWGAETHFELIEEKPNFYVVEAHPVTGRTHQIRVHLACERRPILGDNLYGGKSTIVPRLMLHALRLQVVHPITQQDLTVEAPLPQDMRTLLYRGDPLS